MFEQKEGVNYEIAGRINYKAYIRNGQKMRRSNRGALTHYCLFSFYNEVERMGSGDLTRKYYYYYNSLF